jgi:hypothetical protein
MRGWGRADTPTLGPNASAGPNLINIIISSS